MAQEWSTQAHRGGGSSYRCGLRLRLPHYLPQTPDVGVSLNPETLPLHGISLIFYYGSIGPVKEKELGTRCNIATFPSATLAAGIRSKLTRCSSPSTWYCLPTHHKHQTPVTIEGTAPGSRSTVQIALHITGECIAVEPDGGSWMVLCSPGRRPGDLGSR